MMRFYTHIPAGLLLYTILVWIFGQPYSLAGILIVVLFSVLPDLIDKVTGEHRGWGHSAIWLIPIVAFFFFNPAVGLACFSAFSMHVLLDAVTKKGVPFLYPFLKTRLVMPKKEKSRIQTGSKQETALCVVIVLLLIPLTYCVLFGVPGDLFASASSNSTKLNKTGNNSTKGYYNPYSNLRNSSGYSKGSNYGSTGSSLTKNLKSGNSSSASAYKATNSSSSSSNDDADTDQGLLNWLNQDLTNNNQTNQTTNSSTTQTTDEYGNNIADVLVGPSQTIQDLAAGSDSTDQEDAKNTFFSDLQSQFDNLVEGVPYETNSTDSDQSMFDFDGTINPDADTFEGEESSYSDQFGLMLASFAAIAAGGGLVGKV